MGEKFQNATPPTIFISSVEPDFMINKVVMGG